MANFLPSLNNLNDKSSLVERYFWNEFQYNEVMDFMSNLHNEFAFHIESKRST